MNTEKVFRYLCYLFATMGVVLFATFIVIQPISKQRHHMKQQPVTQPAEK